MGRRTWEHIFFLFFLKLCSESASCNWIPVFFKKNSYYNGYTWPKNITLAVPSGMYNCNFEAINMVLIKKMKKLEMEYGPFIYTIITDLMLCIRFRKELTYHVTFTLRTSYLCSGIWKGEGWESRQIHRF